MRRLMVEFLRRGLIACGLGPIVLAILYWILQQKGLIQTLTVNEVCIGIFSIEALAFIAGGMNVIYQMERLPLMAAVFIHGIVLYSSYLAVYLLNDWMERSILPILVFTGVFVVGYLLIWAVIYFIVRNKTAKLNEILEMKQQNAHD